MPREYDDDLEDVEEIEEIAEIEEIEVVEEVNEFEDLDDTSPAERPRSDRSQERRADRSRRPTGGNGPIATLMRLVAGEPQRPGEQDVARSPLILWLTAGSVVIGLLSLVLYFMILKKSAETQYNFAKTEMEGGKYAQAIELYDKFLADYPDHELTMTALIERGKCRIEKEISGADPNVGPGLKYLEEFVKARRDQPDFDEHKQDIRAWARRITIKAAEKAERTRKKEFLDISVRAQALLSRFAPKEGFARELLAEIRNKQRAAATAILKATTSTDTIAKIKSLIEARKPLDALRARRDLVQRYPMLEGDRELAGLLTRIRETERDLVTVDSTPRDALTDDRPQTAGALTLTAHTTSSSTETSDGRSVFATAADAIYGIDAVTGIPQWRRVIGLNTPFDPVPVEASVPAILTFDTNHGELILIAQADGSLLWRLPLEGEIAKTPFIAESQIYLPTHNNSLYVVGVGTGRQSAKASFSQEIVGPPALSADKDHLVIPGEEEVVYTLQLRPLKCTDVAWLGQQAGTIKAPMIRMGALLLLIENTTSEFSKLRVLRGKPDGTELRVVAETRVEGEVLDAPVLRGRELYVPSNPQRITVFSVNDEPDQDPIQRLATQQLQDVEPTRMYLAPGPGGQLWLAGASLRRFTLKANTLVIDQKVTAEGIHLRPPQQIGEYLYLTRREPFAQSVYFTKANRQSMTSFWRVILGTQLTAVAPQPESDVLTAVSDTGVTFRVASDELTAGGFKLNQVDFTSLPDNLETPVGGARLHDGRLAVYWGSPRPQIVIIDNRGQKSNPINLPAGPEARPVLLDGGIVVPVPGALMAVNPNRGARKVVDYRAPQVRGQTSQWKSLTRLDDTQVVGIDTDNRMIQVQLRSTSGGPANLAEVRIVDLRNPIDQPPIQHDRYLLTADTAGTLTALDARSLEILAETTLPAPPTSPAYGVADRVFVDAGRRETLVFGLGNELTSTGRITTTGVPMAGSPIALGQGFVIAYENGDIIRTDADGNETGQRINVGQDLQSGPIRVGSLLVVTGIDGSFLRIDQLLQGDA